MSLVTIKGRVRTSTDKAYLFVEDETEKEAWIPISQVDYVRPKEWTEQTPIQMDIPKWLADAKELNYEED